LKLKLSVLPYGYELLIFVDLKMLVLNNSGLLYLELVYELDLVLYIDLNLDLFLKSGYLSLRVGLVVS
jgi:hypothetical protein